MKDLPEKINKSLDQWITANRYRRLTNVGEGIDFYSNDYLGLANWRSEGTDLPQGSSGSRLLSGNHPIHEELETRCAELFKGEAALLYSTGYMANLGMVAAIADKGDTLHFDALSHASVRDALWLSRAENLKFRHNDFDHLSENLAKGKGSQFVLAEALYSMDGDIPDLQKLVSVCERHGAYLILDEAHSTGILGPEGAGVTVMEGLEDRIFLRMHSFGKAVGRSGGVVIGSARVRDFLINASRPFIFSTAPSPAETHSILGSIDKMRGMELERKELQSLRGYATIEFRSLGHLQISSGITPIIPLIIPGNEKVRKVANQLIHKGFEVRPILAPTVAEGQERIRLILHSVNTKREISALVSFMKEILS